MQTMGWSSSSSSWCRRQREVQRARVERRLGVGRELALVAGPEPLHVEVGALLLLLALLLRLPLEGGRRGRWSLVRRRGRHLLGPGLLRPRGEDGLLGWLGAYLLNNNNKRLKIIITSIFINQNSQCSHEIESLPLDHLFLDSAPNLGPLISRWEINEFENC